MVPAADRSLEPTEECAGSWQGRDESGWLPVAGFLSTEVFPELRGAASLLKAETDWMAQVPEDTGHRIMNEYFILNS